MAWQRQAARPSTMKISNLLLHQSTQNSQQDAAIFVIGHINRTIKASNRLDGEGRAILSRHIHRHFRARLQASLDAYDIVDLFTSQMQRFLVFALLELQWQNTHTDQVAAVNT